MKRLTFLIIFLSVSASCYADFSRGAGYKRAEKTDRYQQRQIYLDAIHLIRTSQFTRLQKLKLQLRTYPLYPYLEFSEITYRISRQSEEDILKFIEQNKDTPLVQPLLAHWLTNLAKRAKWKTFLRHYAKIEPTKKLACNHAYALHKTGDDDQALIEAERLWSVGFSQPDECDPIFTVWRNAKGLTPDIAWTRFALSLQENKKKLSSYLLRFIDKKDKLFAYNYRMVHFKPRTLKRHNSFKTPNSRNREIILHGAKRLARLDPEEALKTLNRYETLHNFNPARLEKAYAYIGIRLAAQSKDLNLIDSLPVNLTREPDLVAARIRQSLRLNDWSGVVIMLNLLPKKQQATSRWRYWKARALGLSNDTEDKQSARAIMMDLSKERSFYGFLSADILRQEYMYQIESSGVTLEQVLSLEKSPGIQRALELFAIGERSKARREWYFSTSEYNKEESEVAAQVALRWGWYKASIQTMINAKTWDHLDYRFPIAFYDTFLKHARRADIPLQWSLAIARQESAFMPDAKSSAGAMGIMQLMPTTAKLVAKKIGIRYSNTRSLITPDLNIHLGTNYLSQMLRKYDNNRIIASAAYNAGPGRVNRWLTRDISFDVWIEIIPFTETRNYVQNVLLFSNIYSKKMKEKHPIIYSHEREYFSDQKIGGIRALPNMNPNKSSKQKIIPLG